MMKDKKRISILLKIIDQIQNDNEDARNDFEKPMSMICKKEGISYEQVFYILLFDALAFRVENLFQANQ